MYFTRGRWCWTLKVQMAIRWCPGIQPCGTSIVSDMYTYETNLWRVAKRLVEFFFLFRVNTTTYGVEHRLYISWTPSSAPWIVQSYIHKCSTHDYFFLSTCRPFKLSCNTCTWNLINTFIITAIHQQPVHFFTVGLHTKTLRTTFWIIAFLGSFHLPNIYRAVFPSLDITHSLTVD